MCGVIGILHSSGQGPGAALEAYQGLLTLQHRGQDAAGITSFDQTTHHFYVEKNQGTVSQVFNEKNLAKLQGTMAIGHTRYTTAGGQGQRNLQPMLLGYPFGIAMAHNGNIANYPQLRQRLFQESHRQLMSENDLELLLNLWAEGLLAQKLKRFDPFEGFKALSRIFEEVEGAYSVVGLVGGEGMFAFRDPHGLRPLCLGKKTSDDSTAPSYAVASEEVALNFLGYEWVRDVRPGEFLFISVAGELSSFESERVPTAHCMFEWVYFASAESTIERQSVYGVRLRLGEKLARRIRPLMEAGVIQPDIVVPVPDTGRTAAIALAENLGLPYREGLIKNRYIQRSFILGEQKKRESAVELKLSPVRTEIQGKNILLVDDSIVRGTTSKKIVALLKKYGARQVTLAVTCPPIKHGCSYGIDFPDASHLLASGYGHDGDEYGKMAELLGANRVVYTTLEDLAESLGDLGLCTGCLSGRYPTASATLENFAQFRNQQTPPSQGERHGHPSPV